MKSELQSAATLYKSKPAVIFNGQTIPFSKLTNRVAQLANALQAAGIGRGDKVGIYLPNCPQFIESYLAIFAIGAAGVPLDFMLKTDELVSCLSHAEVKLLIAAPKKEIDLTALQKEIKTLSQVITALSPDANYEQLIAAQSNTFPEVIINDNDTSLIMYTSGTTGKPKGIVLTYKHLEGSPAAMKHFVDLSDKDIKLCALPLSHIGGFIYIQNCLKFGITLVLMDRFNPFEFLKLIQQYKVTCFHLVPPMYNAILTLKEIERFDLSSLRWVVVFGAPSTPEIMERFHKYCPNAKLLNGWGMTETCPPNTVTPMNSDNIASIGKPAPHCQIRIIDENTKELPAGQIGEIAISGWIIMKEYYKDTEATAEMLQNGWLHTGDLGRFDQDGFLYIVGRKKEMIKVGGQIVYAPEVETALYKHEAVAEVTVIGIPDKMKGEAVKAFVVLKPGAGITAEDLRHFARQHLANFKVPHEIELRSELPKNRTGKIDKNLLKQELELKN